MRIEEDVKLDFKDVLIRPKRSTLNSRKEVALNRNYKFLNTKFYEFSGVPIIAANMDHTGTIEMAEALKHYEMGVALHKFYSEDIVTGYLAGANRNENVWVSIGARNDDFERAYSIHHRLRGLGGCGIQYLCIDVANGYTTAFEYFVRKCRNNFPETVIMAGNVVTNDMTEQLLLAGADIVKIGIGPGSVCTTRKMTGVGYPQLSAIIECADAAHGLGGHICADGGIQVPGDLAKAFGAGADFVMCGGLFAGHTECSGFVDGIMRDIRPDVRVKPEPSSMEQEVTRYIYTHPDGTEEITNSAGTLSDKFFFVDESKATMRFHGMSSREAMQEHYGDQADYRAAEGKEVSVPYKGSVALTARELLGGLRSACTYVGAKSLKELSKRTTFVQVSRQLNDLFGS
jgi:GMP reductase